MRTATVDGEQITATRKGPYVARSASSKTDEWPLWYVSGADGVNCLRFSSAPMAKFCSREFANAAADALNETED